MCKFYLILFVVEIILFLPNQTYGECCKVPSTPIKFKTLRKSCHLYGAENTLKLGKSNVIRIDKKICRIETCNDGRPVTKGVYCGQGSCNIFGCNCDGGCRDGNQLKLFQEINKHDIEWAKY